jgi:hypothetical protein
LHNTSGPGEDDKGLEMMTNTHQEGVEDDATTDTKVRGP